jgi:DNA-binding transcriptional regulator YiaG
MKTKFEPFEIHIPDAEGKSTSRTVSIEVPVRWDEVIGEWVLTEEAHEMIENRKALEMGILSPAKLADLRERHSCTRKEMGALFQVGEKSWNRWESGKHRLTRSMNLLIRALYDGEISIDYLRERAGIAVTTKQVGNPYAHIFDYAKYSAFESVSVAHAGNLGRSAKKTAKRALMATSGGCKLTDWHEEVFFEELTI